ncbi:hypothetical protein [Streptomyces sp. NPDC058335]|uniref:hypothetical protein n=1 Tax=Streptomyces sp. NPDC058335 TaxID=3346451 RepID=UPI00364D98AF
MTLLYFFITFTAPTAVPLEWDVLFGHLSVFLLFGYLAWGVLGCPGLGRLRHR